MKSFLILAATALTTAVLSLPATAGPVGCNQGDAKASVNAAQCGLSKHKTMRSSAKATHAKASATKKQAIQTERPTTRSGPYQGTSDEPGL
jgi:hypothetical protein